MLVQWSLVASHCVIPSQNSQYLELTAKLLDAKGSAALAKEQGDKAKQKKLSADIRTFCQRKFTLV